MDFSKTSDVLKDVKILKKFFPMKEIFQETFCDNLESDFQNIRKY